MRILVTGGTGTVGSQVVKSLVAKGESVRVLTRSAEKARGLPEGAEGALGSLSEAGSLRAAMDGVDVVFLLTPLAPDETEQGQAGVEAARAAGVRRIVFMSVHKIENGPQIPHFASKIPIEKAVRESGLEFSLIQPNSFFQNDVWLERPIVEYGVYAAPIGGVGLNRVDVRDIADGAVKALTEPGLTGEAYPLVGSDVLTGEDCAATYSRYLGREVRYGGDDLDAWAQQASQMMPEWMVHDLKIMFEHFQQQGLVASDEDLAQQAKLLGRAPRSFEAFVGEVTAAWKASPTPSGSG